MCALCREISQVQTLQRPLPPPASPAATARWRKAYFIPTWWKFNGSVCAGVELVRPVRAQDDDARLFELGVRLLMALRDLSPPSKFAFDGSWFGQPGTVLVDRYAGTPRMREMITAGASVKRVVDAFQPEADAFRRHTRQPFLLYD